MTTTQPPMQTQSPTIASLLNLNSTEPAADTDLETLAPEPSFCVKDEESANWVVRKIVECRNYAERVSAWAAAEIRRAEREEEFFWFRFGAQLQTWAANEVQKLKGRRKSLGLPAGTLGFRAEPAKFVVADEGRLLGWCREHLPEALKARVEATGGEARQLLEWTQAHCPGAQSEARLLKSMVQDHFKATGEIPDGATHVEAGDKFYVK